LVLLGGLGVPLGATAPPSSLAPFPPPRHHPLLFFGLRTFCLTLLCFHPSRHSAPRVAHHLLCCVRSVPFDSISLPSKFLFNPPHFSPCLISPSHVLCVLPGFGIPRFPHPPLNTRLRRIPFPSPDYTPPPFSLSPAIAVDPSRFSPLPSVPYPNSFPHHSGCKFPPPLFSVFFVLVKKKNPKVPSILLLSAAEASRFSLLIRTKSFPYGFIVLSCFAHVSFFYSTPLLARPPGLDGSPPPINLRTR